MLSPMFFVRWTVTFIAVLALVPQGSEAQNRSRARQPVYGPEDTLDVQQDACVPSSNDAKDWPVRAIYLHGWYPKSGNGNYVKLERANRRLMEGIARQNRIRIAIPMARRTHRNGNRTWDHGATVASVEEAAKNACNAELHPRRALIGFSAGGYMTRKLGCSMTPEQQRTYPKVLVVGAPTRARECGRPNMKIHTPHNMNSADIPTFLGEFMDEFGHMIMAGPGTPSRGRAAQ